jgi:hypothetical protein
VAEEQKTIHVKTDFLQYVILTCPEGKESRRVEFLPIVAPIIEENFSDDVRLLKVPYFTALSYGSSNIKIKITVKFSVHQGKEMIFLNDFSVS